MSEIKLGDLAKTLNKDLESIMKEIGSPENMKALADMLKDDIIKRTKLGFGVNNKGESQSKLKPLSESTKKARKHMKLDSTTSPAKSNLTQSGDLLRDLKTVVAQNVASIELGSQESRDKAMWNEQKGRTFMNISKSQILNITNILKKKIAELLK